VTCSDFERWLDEGMTEAQAGAAALHERDCARCATALAAARKLELLLGAAPAAAPAGFASRIMARIDRVAVARAPASRPEPALPWWVEWAAEPAGALALVLAALLIWRGGWIWGQLEAQLRGAPVVEWLDHASTAVAAIPTLAPGMIPSLTADSLPAFWLGPAVMAVALLAALPLYRWSSRLGTLLASSHLPKPI
jgi:hypothetical protein